MRGFDFSGLAGAQASRIPQTTDGMSVLAFQIEDREAGQKDPETR